MSLTSLPTAPSRADPANFATRADAMMAALPVLVTELNAELPVMNEAINLSPQAVAAAANAANSALAAAQSAALAAAVAGGTTGAYPAIRPALLIDFVNGRSIDPRITFSRNSTATRINAAGNLETVAANVPRIDHDPATEECLGLLLEEASTNLCLRSETFTDSSWVTSNATKTTGVVDPWGGAQAATCTCTSSAGYLQNAGATIVNGSTYTMSLWVRRRAGSAQVSLRGINDVDVPITVTADWQRYSYTAVANSTTGRVGVRLTANGDAVDIYGGQLELLPYMTSYIPTTSAAVSRAAEMASITGAAFSSWFNAGQGSFVVGLRWAYLQSTSVAAGISVSDGTVSNAHSLVRSGVGAVPQYSAAVAGVSQAAPYAGAVTAMVPFLCAFAYAANDFAIRTQGAGGSFAADSSGALPVVDRLNFGATDGSVARKHVTRLAYYPKRLLDAELATLSTQ